MMRRIAAMLGEAIRRYFVAGVVFFAPIGITIWAMASIVVWLDNLILPKLLQLILPGLDEPPQLPLIGMLFTFIVIILLGVIGVWAAAALCGLLALAAPALLRPVYVALTAISLPIGFVLSHVIMAVFFYLIFTPLGLLFRAMGRDPLCRTIERDAKSYWVRREPVTDARRYFRQF